MRPRSIFAYAIKFLIYFPEFYEAKNIFVSNRLGISNIILKINMVLVCLGQLKSKIKVPNINNHTYKIKEKQECFLQLGSKYNRNATKLKSNKV